MTTMTFRGKVDRTAMVIEVTGMGEVAGIQAALEGKQPIYYELNGVRFMPVKATNHVRTSRSPKPVVTIMPAAPKVGKDIDFTPPPVPAIIKTILEFNDRGEGHNVQDLIVAHTGARFPDRRGQMANVYVQWVRRAQAARARLEEEQGLVFELQNTGRGRAYFGRRKGA